MTNFAAAPNQDDTPDDSLTIAIVGMAGRFPRSADLEQFWDNLRNGVECIDQVSDAALQAAGVDASHPDYVKVVSSVAGVDLFDAGFFGMTPREAAITDPQQRLFLECAWEALEHAGYDPSACPGAVGVYAGAGINTYLLENLYGNAALRAAVGPMQLVIANQTDFLCTRVAYHLNLRGPAVVVQSACSTSLVAVHLACQSILNGECDMAIAGGVAVNVLNQHGYQHTEGSIFSRDGHCRAFDADASGTVAGNGLGIVVLKSLASARADGDTIHALIRGSAINNDGSDKIGYTAPSVDGQSAVITEAIAVAGIDAASVSYVEAHGTGTSLGDPIEIKALQQAFEDGGTLRRSCALGSLKSNMGHLDAAAGVAGLIKTVLSLKHRQLPPSLHYTRANPHIDFENSPFYVNAALADWPAAQTPRRAGVSSFGIGGTNAHIVLEEAPAQAVTAATQSPQLLVLSAKTAASLDAATAKLKLHLETHGDTNLADAAFTLQQGRRHFIHRRAVVCSSIATAIEGLGTAPQLKLGAEKARDVIFMFPGQGAQYVGMGRDLYARESVFRAAIDECALHLAPALAADLRTILFPVEEYLAGAAALLDRTEWTQPILFSVEYALARQFMAWGVTPSAMLGHSLGEYVCACIADVMSLKDALALVAARGRLIASMPAGRMLAVSLAEAELAPMISDGVWLAAVNGATSCTVSGIPAAVAQLQSTLSERGVACQLLPTLHAFHSGMMDPLLDEFRAMVAAIPMQGPRIAYLSNLTGAWIDAAQVRDPAYWVGHLRQPVRFDDCVASAKAKGDPVFIEIGPGATLCNFIKRGGVSAPATVSTLPHRLSDASGAECAMAAVGQLWMHGARVDLASLHGGAARHRIPLPSYAFEQQRYWVDAQRHVAQQAGCAQLAQFTALDQIAPAQALISYDRPSSLGKYVAPAEGIEAGMCALWQTLLGISPIGVQDNFFTAGGDSLLATQAMSQLRTAFKTDLPLTALFDTPTIAALAALVAKARDAGAQDTQLPMVVVDRHGSLALSFAQQRLWFLDQLDPGSSLYNLPVAVRLSGVLDVVAFHRSLNEVVRRHEALRTSFVVRDGVPAQVIADDVELEFDVVDLSALPHAEREAKALWLGQDAAQSSFDLAAGPLVRASLIRLDEREHIVVFTVHHIVSDGWSMGVLVREMAALYGAFVQGKPSPLAPLALQYADFAHWQRQWLSGAVLQEQLGYWTRQLAGAPTLLALPTDRPRPALQSYRGANLAFAVPAATLAGLHALGAATQSTLFMTLGAAFNVLLSRYSGQGDICIGTAIANRNRAEIEDLIGFFVNTLVLRTQVDPHASFESLLAQVKATALAAYAHQDVPFEQLVEALKPQRHLSHAPLFQVMLVLQNAPLSMELPGLTLHPVAGDSGTAKFDLTLNLVEEEGCLKGLFEYSTDLFDAATIERMAGHFANLLGAIVAAPSQRVGQFDMLGDAERAQLLIQWNAAPAIAPCIGTMHELFEQQVARTPDAVALVWAGASLSYAQLNGRANQLARHLRERGVGPDVLVGVCVERSLDMIVALLATLKAGGAYVPLDPAYPQERLAYMLADAEPAVLLTQAKLRARWLDAATPVFCLDADWDAVAGLDDANLSHTSTPEHLAYLIYTSGSTGRPKGVSIAHRNASVFIAWAKATFGEEELARVLASTSICFDLSIFEIFVPLCSGGSAWIVDSILALCADPDSYPVTLINTVPSAIAELNRQGAIPATAKVINLAGEALPNALVQAIYENNPVERIYNLYGPSEDTTYSTFALTVKGATTAVPIGRPIDHTQAYILDAALQPVPIGVAGELYLGGAGLARGYLRRPDLTAERFVPDPFAPALGARMYMTGDLTRYLADGTIEYLGRIDNQVKIRGFRIELGEIEVALVKVDGVREALVLAREDGAVDGMPADRRLVAYLVTEQAPEPALLRAALQRTLPHYMVPSHFIALPAFPLSPNGKIDRKALPAPDVEAGKEEYVAPGSEVEVAVAGIWGAVLKLDRVGAQDNFFTLGGHSLLATQVISQLRATLGAELPLRALFEAPTVAALAAMVESAQHEQTVQSAMPMLPMARGGDLPLSFAQQRLWFLDQFETDSAMYNVPMAVRISGKLNVDALRRGLNEVVLRHEALRTTFATRDGVPVQIIAEHLELALEVVDLRALPSAEREAKAQWLAQTEAQTSFDLSCGPLIRASLLKLDDEEHHILFNTHHIISDGWSMGILTQELASLYVAFAQGQAAQLPPLTLQYADFAHWQRQWLASGELTRQLGYWSEQLAGAPTLLTLPTDRPRPAMQSYAGANIDFTIPSTTLNGLLSLGSATQSTLFMVATAAFNILLCRYSGQADICVGTAIANRNRAEIEALIGFFVNTLVLRTHVDQSVSFNSLLAQVRTTALAAYAHQDVPFEQLVEALKPERHLSHAPLFQVMLVLQNAPGSVSLPGLTLTPLAGDNGSSKFDLTLNLVEADGCLQASFEYNTDLFDQDTIERMAVHFTTLLAAIAHDSTCAVAELAMMSCAELDQLQVGWNATGANYPHAMTLHQRFEEQVAKTPDAPALVHAGQTLSYTQLNERANQLAFFLRSHGLGPDRLVGICLERSMDMVIAVFGILKAGGAYLPLDPSFPAERLAYMCADAQPVMVLTQSSLRGLFAQDGVACFDMDGQAHARAALPAQNLANVNVPEHLAYVIYTSGSSGRPKGVLTSHRNVSNLASSHLANIIHRSDAGPLRCSFNAPLAFDASVSELILLLDGHALFIIPDEARLSSEALADFLATHRLEVFDSSPAQLKYLLDQNRPDIVPKTVLFGGDSIDAKLWQRLRSMESHRFFNAYGPTECTVDVAIGAVREGPDFPVIGRAQANTQLYILDEHLNPVPRGVAGQLHIAGDGLARGYLNRPDLTAEKFIPNPFGGVSGARMYQSGDLARYHADGNIEYLGRIDDQVKIRGFRIELGEVEAALAQVPGVHEAAVLARDDGPGGRRLVAYVAGADGVVLAPDSLRMVLLESLPDYMVPAHFVVLDKLPSSSNGKVDRKALPAPDMTRNREQCLAPRSPTEQTIADIWSELLAIPPFGVHDNFFALGGHSLLATQVVSKLRVEFGVDLPLRALFEAPTVAQLAQMIVIDMEQFEEIDI